MEKTVTTVRQCHRHIHPVADGVDSCAAVNCAPRVSWTSLLTRIRRDARAAFAARASRVSRASEVWALNTPDRHTRAGDTRGCLSPSPRISSPTGASARRLARVSEPKFRIGTPTISGRTKTPPGRLTARSSRASARYVAFEVTRDHALTLPAVLEPSRPQNDPRSGLEFSKRSLSARRRTRTATRSKTANL